VELFNALMSLLSNDKYEVEYEFVDAGNNGIKTKSNVLRGWPSVIFAQAIDYSHYARYHDKLCFVLMPFAEKYKSVYDIIIKPAAKQFDLEAKRADDIFDTKPIIQDIWEHINKAKLIIANLSRKNPMYFMK
jgi:hypothetical protein